MPLKYIKTPYNWKIYCCKSGRYDAIQRKTIKIQCRFCQSIFHILPYFLKAIFWNKAKVSVLFHRHLSLLRLDQNENHNAQKKKKKVIASESSCILNLSYIVRERRFTNAEMFLCVYLHFYTNRDLHLVHYCLLFTSRLTWWARFALSISLNMRFVVSVDIIYKYLYLSF